MAKWHFFTLFCAVVLLVELLCPYTKVEESFGMQAMHDFLYCENTSCFDHLSFPGVVPRSFFGPWFTAVMTLFPFVMVDLLSPWDFVQHKLIQNPMILSHACRISLGILVCGSFWYVSSSLTSAQSSANKKELRKRQQGASGKTNWRCQASSVFLLLSLSQFHLVYYASRPLPNTYGLILTTLACGCTLRGRYYHAVALLSAASSLFRCDVLVLLAPFGIFHLFNRNVALLRGVRTGLTATLFSLCVSVPMDSFLWGRWLWPESVVLFFNTAENQSWKWGRQPAHWYATFALPRAFLFVYPLLIVLVCLAWLPGTTGSLLPTGTNPNISMIRRLCSLWTDVAKRHRSLLIPSSFFIALYSALPHKEIRFIMVIFPWFLAPLSAAIAETWNMLVVPSILEEGKNSQNVMRGTFTSPPKRKCRICVIFMVLFISVLQLATVGVSVFVSMHNYPGARALSRLHQIIENDKYNTSSCIAKHEKTLTVFIDAYAAMTGINRFQKQHSEFLSTQPLGNWNVVKNAPNALLRRLVALLAFPFSTLKRTQPLDGGERSHLEPYNLAEPFGLETFTKSNGIMENVPQSSSPLSSIRENTVVQLYTKDTNRFDEAGNLYRGEGIDYLIVRYSQREMHYQHNEFEEVFTEYVPDWRATVQNLMHIFFSRTGEGPSAPTDGLIAYPEPFLLALRRRC